MTSLDYAVLAAYFLVVIAIGLRTRRSVHTSDDFFLSGRSLPSWITGLAFMAANLGSFELMGFAANGAKYGMFTNQLYWIGSVPAMIFAGLVMVRFFYNAKIRSVPEFLRLRFDEKCRGLNAISFAFLTIFTSGLSLYGLAIVFHALFGWSIDLCIWLSGGTVLFYVMSGGLRASIYTEVLQFFLMVLGILPLSVMALRSVGGLSRLLSRLPDTMTHTWVPVLHPEGTPYGAGLGSIFIGLMVASFAYWSTDFLVIQRALAAKDLDAAQKTPLIATFPKMFFPILTVVPGLIALLVIPHQIQGNFNMTLPLMFLHYYPAGLLGVGITALLSSFMSGMAGNVTAFNTVWTYDLYQNYIAPHRSDHHYLIVGRVVTIVGIVISIATAYSARAFPNIFDYWALLSGIFVGAPFGTFVLGVFTARVRGTAAFCGMLTGIFSDIAHYFLYEAGYLHYGSVLAMDFTGAAVGFFANIGTALLITMVQGPTPITSPAHWWKASAFVAARPWYRTPEALACLSFAVMVVLNLIFW
ncbi:MAG TPA: sodium/solute symporter [Bryobacteraceae bacterium]|nr:sodium/solute symporter [Bryobacteraceae bacterium]